MTGSGSRIDDRFRLARLARGLSQGALADVAGVTRQSISGIESGRWSPSLEVALALAAALGTSVEDLFGATPELPRLEARLAAPARESARLLVSQIDGSPVAFPLVGDFGFAPGFRPTLAHATASQGAPAGSLVEIQPIASPGPTLAVAGCDPALALLAGPLERHRPPTSLVWWSCNNTAGQRLLEAGSVHAAAVHRRADEEPGRASGYEIVGFAAWREGLVVARKFADAVHCLAEAVELGLVLVNREPGSEARRLLDVALGEIDANKAELPRLRHRMQRPPARGIFDRGWPGRRRSGERTRRAGLRAWLRAVAGGDLRAAYPPLAARHRGGPSPLGRACK